MSCWVTLKNQWIKNSVMNIDKQLLDNLTAHAQASSRLRMNMDLRNSDADSSQRMLNAIEPGSVVPVHRHQKTSETVVVLRGRVGEEYYDDLERVCCATYELSAGGPICALNIPAGHWHTLRAHQLLMRLVVECLCQLETPRLWLMRFTRWLRWTRMSWWQWGREEGLIARRISRLEII